MVVKRLTEGKSYLVVPNSSMPGTVVYENGQRTQETFSGKRTIITITSLYRSTWGSSGAKYRIDEEPFVYSTHSWTLHNILIPLDKSSPRDIIGI